MIHIRALKPNVTREQAIQQFSSNGVLRAARAAVLGPLRSVADFYIPFRVFRIKIQDHSRREIRILAIDSVTGTLMPYSFEQCPGEHELLSTETRNHALQQISEDQASQIAVSRAQRQIFSRGFFRVRELKISAHALAEIHVPYWIGFRGRDKRAGFAVMDAVRRRIEGAKVRQIVQNWLISEGR